MEYINADLSHPFARVSYEEMMGFPGGDALMSQLEADMAGGVSPTGEMTLAARDAAGYGQDDRVLCIEPDTTDDGTVIPEWAFE